MGKLVFEATQFSKVKNSQHQAASIIWVHEQYIQGDIFCWHIFVRSSVSSGHTCLSGHCPSLIFAEFHFQFIFKIILYSPLHRSSGFPWSFYVIRFWLSNQIGLGPANCSQVLPLNLWKTFFKIDWAKMWWGRVYLSCIIRFGLSLLLLKGVEVGNVPRTNEECPQKSKMGKIFPRRATKKQIKDHKRHPLKKTDHQLEDCLGSADTAINNNNNKTSSKQEKVTIDVTITNIIMN